MQKLNLKPLNLQIKQPSFFVKVSRLFQLRLDVRSAADEDEYSAVNATLQSAGLLLRASERTHRYEVSLVGDIVSM